MMLLTDVVTALGLQVLTSGVGFDREVRGGIVCDLLSIVLAKAQPQDMWITIQRHQNIVAVAKVTSVAGVILADGIVPEQDVIDRASEEGILLLATKESSFVVCGKLFALLSSEEE
ncbi:serine kinase [Candidatus Bipolaricaulota bacterium]|nr:serine kinase [Candidatus Bipolaricaulota bacterium]